MRKRRRGPRVGADGPARSDQAETPRSHRRHAIDLGRPKTISMLYARREARLRVRR